MWELNMKKSITLEEAIYLRVSDVPRVTFSNGTYSSPTAEIDLTKIDSKWFLDLQSAGVIREVKEDYTKE